MPLNHRSLRNHIAFEAARLLHDGQETEYPRAKRRAARSIGLRFRPNELPSNREVRDHLRRIEEVVDAASVTVNPRTVLLEGVRLMRIFKGDHPRISLSDRELPLVETKARLFIVPEHRDLTERQILRDRLSFVLCDKTPAMTLFSSTTLPIEILWIDRDEEANGMDLPTMESILLDATTADILDAEIEGLDPDIDRFEAYEELLKPLEDVPQDPRTHPEGDALFHSLQVFDLAVLDCPYDEEFLTAALLHDVGKAAGRESSLSDTDSLLDGIVTHRTRWFIEHLPLSKLQKSRQLPPELRKQLERSEDWTDLLRLRDFDEMGRVPGKRTRSLRDAIDYLRRMDSAANGSEEWD